MKRLATGLLLLVLCPQGFGWGHEGHRIVADIAEVRLSSAARANFQKVSASSSQSLISGAMREERDFP